QRKRHQVATRCPAGPGRFSPYSGQTCAAQTHAERGAAPSPCCAAAACERPGPSGGAAGATPTPARHPTGYAQTYTAPSAHPGSSDGPTTPSRCQRPGRISEIDATSRCRGKATEVFGGDTNLSACTEFSAQ